MDIKQQRRDAAMPEPEGMYPTGKKGLGSAASDSNVGWDVRAQSWQRGADTDCRAIDAEKRENDTRYGVPYEDVLADPAANNSPDGPLPNPHNFSNNPGFMPASAARGSLQGSNSVARSREAGGGWTSGSTIDSKSNPTIGRSGVQRSSSVGLPAQQQTDPGIISDGTPQVRTTGFGG